MKNLLENLYLVFFSPTEFPYFWGQYHSKFLEFWIVLFSSFCFSLGISLHATELSSIEIFLYLFVWNTSFFFLFPLVFAWLVNQASIEFRIQSNQKIFISYLKYSLSVFSFLPSFIVLINFLELSSTSMLILILSGLGLVYFWNIIRGIIAIYKLERGIAISIFLRSLYWIIVLPLFFSFYYLVTFLVFII